MALDVGHVCLGFAVALGVGGLVGLERERHAHEDDAKAPAGIRTFPLISLMGALAALLAVPYGNLVVALAFAAIVVLVGVAYWWQLRSEAMTRLGFTTEIAALVVFLIGALPFAEGLGLAQSHRLLLAAGLGAVLMSVLALRGPLHAVAASLEAEDIYATVRFVLIAAVMLPLLPDKPYGPSGVLNPFVIGAVVVLIAAISFVGYIAVRLLGRRLGTEVTALLGGLVSSTVVTITFSRHARSQERLVRIAALAIALASAVMFPRMAVEVAVVRQELLGPLLLPLGAMLAASLVGSAVLWHWSRQREARTAGEPEFANPFRLTQAFQLALIFTLVRLVVAVAYEQFGSSGLYASSALAGTTNVDALTLSVARMQGAGLSDAAAAVAVTLAAVSNTLVKAALAFIVGGRRLGIAVSVALAPVAVAGVVVALLIAP